MSDLFSNFLSPSAGENRKSTQYKSSGILHASVVLLDVIIIQIVNTSSNQSNVFALINYFECLQSDIFYNHLCCSSSKS